MGGDVRAAGSMSAVAWVLTMAVSSCANPPSTADAGAVKTSIIGSMQDSAVAWSKGDLDGFMSGYENSADTTYVTGSKVVIGYDAIRAMYRARFGAGRDMGLLSMTMSSVRSLGADYAIGLGRYALRRPGLTQPLSGVYTLVFHRTDQGWKIVSDHTSS